MADPGDWETRVNPSGKMWYFNKATGTTTFERPDELEQEASSIPSRNMNGRPSITDTTPTCQKCKEQNHFTKDCPQLYIRPIPEQDPTPNHSSKPRRDAGHDRMADRSAPPMLPYSLPNPYPYAAPTFGFPVAPPAPFGPYFGPVPVPSPHRPMPPPGYPQLPAMPPPFIPTSGAPMYASPPPGPGLSQPHLPFTQMSKRASDPQPIKPRSGLRKTRGQGSWIEIREAPAPSAPTSRRASTAVKSPPRSREDLEKQIEHATAKAEVLQQAGAQRDATVQSLRQEIKDVKEQMEKVRSRADEAQKERDATYEEMERVLEEHEQERQQMAMQLFRGIAEEDARSFLTPEQFHRWYPTAWRITTPTSFQSENGSPAPPYGNRPPVGPYGPYGPPMMGYPSYPYGPMMYPYGSGAYGYPYGY